MRKLNWPMINLRIKTRFQRILRKEKGLILKGKSLILFINTRVTKITLLKIKYPIKHEYKDNFVNNKIKKSKDSP